MGLADDFDALLKDLPEDWSFFETFVMLDDASHLAEARVALGRANARPVKGPGRVDFEITVANTWGRGAAPGVPGYGSGSGTSDPGPVFRSVRSRAGKRGGFSFLGAERIRRLSYRQVFPAG